MDQNELNALSASLVRMFRPLARLLLRRGISYKTFSNLLKWVFVDVARKEFVTVGRKQSVSRVSVITGLTRKEVSRVINMPKPQDQESAEKYNRAARVIAGWRRDRSFRDNRGSVAALEFKGDGATFSELVRRYSGDLPARALLDELLRIETVRILKNGRIKLVERSYVPTIDQNVKLHILGVDVGHLIDTIDHNLRVDKAGDNTAYFQRKTKYDNIPDAALPQIRLIITEASQHLIEKLDAWMATKDRDCNTDLEGSGRNFTGIGIYYFEGPFDEED